MKVNLVFGEEETDWINDGYIQTKQTLVRGNLEIIERCPICQNSDKLGWSPTDLQEYNNMPEISVVDWDSHIENFMCQNEICKTALILRGRLYD